MRYAIIFFCLLAQCFSFFILTPSPVLASGPKNVAVCPNKGFGFFHCTARVVTNDALQPLAVSTPLGFGPSQLRSAYGTAGMTKTNTTIAIVDAFDAPTVFSDLSTYSSTFGIQPLAQCAVQTGTIAKPCFEKINQRGTSAFPKVDSGWALETSLDVEMAHAMCQNCNILLVEADSDSFNDLLAAVDTAVADKANVVSNSYGTQEFAQETQYDGHFKHLGVMFTVSSGDDGYGVSYPAASQYVTAVGGTTLKLTAKGTYSSESAWSDGGSGCSVYEPKLPHQTNSQCSHRMVADVAAEADPATGVAVYDSTAYQGQKGWTILGGTSVAAPLVAGIAASAGHVSGNTYGNSLPYLHGTTKTLHDVKKGSNGSCTPSIFCSAIRGYDGPTGLGSPKGSGAL